MIHVSGGSAVRANRRRRYRRLVVLDALGGDARSKTPDARIRPALSGR